MWGLGSSGEMWGKDTECLRTGVVAAGDTLGNLDQRATPSPGVFVHRLIDLTALIRHMNRKLGVNRIVNWCRQIDWPNRRESEFGMNRIVDWGHRIDWPHRHDSKMGHESNCLPIDFSDQCMNSIRRPYADTRARSHAVRLENFKDLAWIH